MAAALLARKVIKYALNKVAPGATKAQRDLAVKSTMKQAINKLEGKAYKAYLANKPKTDKSMLQMADKIRKDMETLFGKKK